MSDDHHIVPISLYFKVFAALMVLTFITVWISGVDMGVLNTPVALLIAIVKATLVLSIFMHLKYSRPLIGVIAVTGFIWLAVMIGITMSDYKTRDWLPDPEPFVERHLPEVDEKAHGDKHGHGDDHGEQDH